jgi:serine phosphatase RsbU (regulator of sigma subunit)
LKEDTKNAAELLSKVYARSSNFEKAYEYALLFKTMNDSIFTLENQKQIHTIENRFEIERKQREIELQSAKLARQEVEIRQQHYKQNVLLVGFVSVLAVVLLFVIAYYRIRKAKKLIQKQKGQIEESNEELNQSNEELNVTIETVNQQKLQIEKTNKEITGSIHYAKYIQNAILPKSETFNKFLKDHFVLYKPKDIVSGDFYWTTELEGRTIIATADCTGHGVPGAFMSMLGVSFLNDIINKEYITHPAVILRRLRKEVIHALQQKGEMGEQRDGMDMGICSIDFKAMELQYSGANCPLYIIRNKNRQGIDNAIKTEFNDAILYEIKGDRMPISIYEKMDKFNLVEISLQKGDLIYMFSDGFSDQFGGVDGKRFKYKPFKQLLLENCEKPMIDQKSELDKAFYNWKQDCDQIDDVMVLGFLV